MQSWLASRSASFLSSKLNTHISIQKVSITPGLQIRINDVRVHDNENHPILDIKSLDVTRLRIRSKVHQIHVSTVAIDSLDFKIHTQPNDTISNLGELLRHIPSGNSSNTTASAPWTIEVDRISLLNSQFENRNFNNTPTPSGIDWNHNIIRNLNGEFKNLIIRDDSITTRIQYIGFTDHSGFSITSASGNFAYSPTYITATSLKIKTPHSDLDFDFALRYSNILDFQDLFNKVVLSSDFRLSRLSLDDLVFFAPELNGLFDLVWMEGKISGPISNLVGDDIEIVTGKETRILTDVAIIGLPDAANTFYTFNIQDLYTTPSDLQSFYLPSGEDTYKLILPKNLDSLEYCRVSGFFGGYLTDFQSSAQFKTNLGDITTDIQVSKNSATGNLKYAGIIKAKRLQAGILGEIPDMLGSVDLSLMVSGTGTNPETMMISLNGTMDSLIYKDEIINRISINGTYDHRLAKGNISLDDELGMLKINGLADLQIKNPSVDLSIEITNADLQGLQLTDSLNQAFLSTTLYCKTIGFDPDYIQGHINASNTLYVSNGDSLKVSNISIEQQITKDKDYNKTINFDSDFVDLYASGDMMYEYIPHALKTIKDELLPKMDQNSISDHSIDTEGGELEISIKLKNTTDLLAIFMPSINISSGTYARIHLGSHKQNLSFDAHSTRISISSTTIDNLSLDADFDTIQGSILISSDEIILLQANEQDSVPISLQNFYLNSLVENDSVQLRLEWDDSTWKDHNKGFINAYASLSEFPDISLGIRDNNLIINDTTWKLHNNNQIKIDSTGYTIQNFGFASSTQGLDLNGKISSNINDTLTGKFSELNLSLLDFFMPEEIRFRGFLNGTADITNLYKTPNFISDLTIRDFELNSQPLGELSAKTTWNNNQNHLDVMADLVYTGNIGSDTTLFIHGFYSPSNASYFDFNVGTKNFNVEVAKPWLQGVANNISGRMSGGLRLFGTLEEPVITGKIFFRRTGFKIDYTKVDYTMADEIFFEKNTIAFKDFTINDPFGNQLILNGNLNHNYFDDFAFDMNMEFKEINVLRTSSTDNSNFYGNIFSSGNMKLTGLLDNMFINANISTQRGTDVYVPVTYSVDISSNDFITFINSKDTTQTDAVVKVPRGSGINIDTRIQVDPNTNLRIFLPSNMGNMEVQGFGDIRFLMDDQYNYQIFGDYEISQGKFLFTLQNVIRRSFNIREGSTIKLTGDAMEATMDVKAVYHLRAGLNGLPTADTTLTSRRIPVDCVLGLSGSVSNPMINFQIEMPDVEDETRELIYSTIDTSNNTVMTQQMLSLLVLNSFSFSSPNTALTSGLGATSFDILTNQLSNWLSQISKDFDIGINYRPGDEITQEEVEVALRTQLFNDRVIIDGNIGVMGTDNTENTSNIVGDVNIEVKMTKDGRLRLKAYNKSNNTDVLNSTSPYTQGVGLSFYTEFDKFSDIFRRKNKRKKK